MDTKQRIYRLLPIARSDTGGSSRVAQFLLSLWNGDRYRVDLQELLYIDRVIFQDMMQVMNDLYQTNTQLDSYINETDIEPVIENWGHVYKFQPFDNDRP
jgi:hypothetical protein